MSRKAKKLPSLKNSQANSLKIEPSPSSLPDYGIEQFEAEKCTKPPIFHDPVTIEAMKRLGIEPETKPRRNC